MWLTSAISRRCHATQSRRSQHHKRRQFTILPYNLSLRSLPHHSGIMLMDTMLSESTDLSFHNSSIRRSIRMRIRTSLSHIILHSISIRSINLHSINSSTSSRLILRKALVISSTLLSATAYLININININLCQSHHDNFSQRTVFHLRNKLLLYAGRVLTRSFIPTSGGTLLSKYVCQDAISGCS
jgi:hypothetical protein